MPTTEEKLREIFVNHFQKYLPYFLNGSGEKFRQDAEESVQDIMKLFNEKVSELSEKINNNHNKNGNRKNKSPKT